MKTNCKFSAFLVGILGILSLSLLFIIIFSQHQISQHPILTKEDSVRLDNKTPASSPCSSIFLPLLKEGIHVLIDHFDNKDSPHSLF